MRVPLTYRAETGRPVPPAGPGGAWYGRCALAERKLYLLVAGDAAAPDPSLEATLWQVVDGFEAIARAIEAFAAALVPDGRVPFSTRPAECFAAGNCGFARGAFFFDRIEVVDPARPSVAVVGFVTGEPDGHVSYAATIDGGRPIEILAEV